MAPTCFAISPDSQLLLAGTRSNLLLLFDLPKRALLHAMELGPSPYGATHVQFLPDSRSATGALLGQGPCLHDVLALLAATCHAGAQCAFQAGLGSSLRPGRLPQCWAATAASVSWMRWHAPRT